MSLLQFTGDLLRLANPGKPRFVALAAYTAGCELLLLPIPFLFAWLLSRIENGSWYDVLWFALAAAGLQGLYGLASVARVRLGRQIALGAANRLRDRFFAHVLHLPYAFFLQQQGGGTANAWLNDIDDVDAAVADLVETGLRTLFALAFTGIALALWNPQMAGLALVLVPLTVFAQRRLRSSVHNKAKTKTDLRQDMASTLSEAAHAAPVLKAFTLEAPISKRIISASAAFERNDVRLETTQSALRSSASVVLVFTQYSFFVAGGWMVIAGSLTLPALLGQLVLVNRLIGPLANLLQYLGRLTQGHAGLHRVRGILERPREDAGRSNAAAMPSAQAGCRVECSDVRFRFHAEVPLLEGVSFSVQPGETVAIVGASGSGKTTLLNLLLGLHGPWAGSITVDGIDAAQAPLAELRARMGVVFQEQVLFNTSIRENLLLAVPDSGADDATLWNALEQAHADDFVRALPEGLDTKLGQDGVRLSGGQRQRLAIARVVLRNPPLLLLDEATSALDSLSERHIQDALNQLLRGRSALVVAHRLSTVVHANRIIVLEGGRVVEQGTHSELLEQGGAYARLHAAQIRGFQAEENV